MKMKALYAILALVFVVTLIAINSKGKRDAERRQNAKNLGASRDPKAVLPLITYLEDTDADVRYYAIRALGDIGDIRAVDPVIARLRDKNEYVRGAAVDVLGKFGDARAAEPLVARLGGDDYRMAVLDAIAKIGPPSVVPLRAKFPEGKPRPLWAVLVLAVCGDENATAEILRNVAQDSYSTEDKTELMRYWVPHAFHHKIEDAAKDPGLRIAARAERLGYEEWDLVLNAAVNNPELLQVTSAAIEYCPKNLRWSRFDKLVQRCIQHGDKRSVPHLIQLLEYYGNGWHAQVLLNCGQKDLEAAAVLWAKKHRETLPVGPDHVIECWGVSK